MRSLDILGRAAFCVARGLVGPASLAVSALVIGCANGGGSGTPGGSGGDGGTTATTTTTTGGGGETTTGGSGGIGGSGGTGGTGGMTTTTTSSSSTSSTTSTTSSVVCPEPANVAGYTIEVESNNLASDATPLASGTTGFSGAICPAGDVDVFALPVMVGGSGLTVSVKGNGVACPPGFKSYVRVFDPSGALVAQDADSFGGSCASITPFNNAGAASLAAGTYHIQVENISFASVDSYLLDVQLSTPACGDGLLQVDAGEQCDDGNTTSGDGCTADCLIEAVCGDGVVHVVAGEQCDDGNTIAGDGCSPTCQFEAVLLTESEPNGPNSPNCITGYDGAVASISPIGDQDYFCFDVTVPGSTVTISTSDGLNDCPADADTKIYLYDAANTELAYDDDDGAGTCSLISPANDAVAGNLPVGTYRVMVEDYGNNDVIQSYVIKIHVAAPGCGDGLIQAGEQCDDGNVTAGDGCSVTCAFEANYTHEVEPNLMMTPNPVDGFDGVIAAMTPSGDVDVFSFNVTVPGSSVILEVSDGLGACPFDSTLTLYGPGDAQLVLDDDGGIAPCSKIEPNTYVAAANLGVGTYKVKVLSALNATAAQYVLTVKVQPPSCGDTLISAGEQCDDGNVASGDGCSAMCQSEAPWEIEPNDVLNNATGAWAGFGGWNGSIKTIGDHDWFKFLVMTGQSVTLNVHTIGDAASCPFDSKIHLVNAGGNEVIQDDDGGVGNCSTISPALYGAAANLPGGAYYVWVQHFSDASAAGPYQIDLTVQ